MQHAEWLGNTTALIIIIDNDIYLRQSPADEEDIRLTHTGVPGLIYNGITDWLYQGEHLSSSKPAIMATEAFQLFFFRFFSLQRKFSRRRKLCGDLTMAPCSCMQRSTIQTSVR
jgi:hypothetical protein